MTDFAASDFDDELMLLAAIIHDVEEDKAVVRREYEHMKEVWHRCEWRKEGYNKGEFSAKLDRVHGELLGFESALRTLYIVQGVRERKKGIRN